MPVPGFELLCRGAMIACAADIEIADKFKSMMYMVP